MAEGENQDFVLFHLRAESLELVGAQVAKSSSSLIRIKIILKKGGEEVEHQEERGRRSVSAEPILQKKPTDPRFFVYFLGDIFLWQSEVCCSLFFGTPTQGDEDDLLFDSSFKTRKENAKSLYNSNSSDDEDISI